MSPQIWQPYFAFPTVRGAKDSRARGSLIALAFSRTMNLIHRQCLTAPKPHAPMDTSASPLSDTNYESEDDCSIGIANLMEESKSRHMSFVSLSDRHRSPPSVASSECGASLSKLDVLRARNQHMRRRGSLKIAETRRSLHASTSSLQVPRGSSRKLFGDEESTIGSVAGRTWAGPTSLSSADVQRPIPFHVLLDGEQRLEIERKSPACLSSFDYVNQYRRLQEENEMLRRRMNLLERQHELFLRRDRASIQSEFRNRARNRRNRISTAAVLLVVFFVAFSIFAPHGTGGAFKFVLDNTIVPFLLQRIYVEDSRKQALEVKPSLAGDQISHTTTSPDMGIIGGEILENASLPDKSSMNECVLMMSEREDAPLQTEPLVEKTSHRLGPIKKLLYNVKNDTFGVWLKHIKI